MNYRTIAKLWVPPIAVGAVRSIRRWIRQKPPVPDWEYVAEVWTDNDPRSTGWLDDSVAATQRQKWSDFQRSLKGTGPLGISHEAHVGREITSLDYSAHNIIMTFAYVLARAAHRRETLSILDWGGGLGHYALIARALLAEVAIDYFVHDVPALCAAGREIMPDLTFTSDEATTFVRRYDLVFASSSLHYVQDWKAQMTKLAAAAQDWLYLTRVPTVRATPSFVIVQRPQAYGYDKDYISWVLNRDDLLAHAQSSGLIPEREFLVEECPVIAGAPEQCAGFGMLFRTATRNSG
jgi:putative methyltransferase (TIGR04325 family)